MSGTFLYFALVFMAAWAVDFDSGSRAIQIQRGGRMNGVNLRISRRASEPVLTTGLGLIVELNGVDISRGLRSLALEIGEAGIPHCRAWFRLDGIDVDAQVLAELGAIATERQGNRDGQ